MGVIITGVDEARSSDFYTECKSESFTARIDALIQNNRENLNHVRDLTRALEKTEQVLADTKKKLRDREWELAQYQRENEQLKQQIYNLQHPQQSWDEPEL